jgi:hypothetical protein
LRAVLVSRALLLLFVYGTLLLPAVALAGTADVLEARVRCRPAPGGRPASVCQFTVTVNHADTGWDHYANRFEIVGPDGKLLVTRVLRHPHVEEQPFTRSQGRVRIPHEIESVEIRAGDLVHGLGGATVTLKVPHAQETEGEDPESPAE